MCTHVSFCIYFTEVRYCSSFHRCVFTVFLWVHCKKIEIPMSNHQTRYNYQSLTRFYYLINKPFCWSCFCSSEEFIWSVSSENNRPFIWLLSNFPSEHNAASLEAVTVLCSSHLHNTEPFLHANSNQMNVKLCDTQNVLVLRTC